MPLVQQSLPISSSCSGSISVHPCLNDIEQPGHDYLPDTQQSAKCGSSNKQANESVRQQSALHDESATNALYAYDTPPRPDRQADQVLQNPFCVGSIADQLSKASNPPDTSSQVMSSRTRQADSILLPDPVPIHQQWLLAGSSLLSPLSAPLTAFHTSGDTTPQELQHHNRLWNSRQSNLSCRPAHLRPGALRRRINTELYESATPHCYLVKLPPVTSRDPRRQACSRTAVSPEVSASSSQVRALMLLVLHVLWVVFTIFRLLKETIPCLFCSLFM